MNTRSVRSTRVDSRKRRDASEIRNRHVGITRKTRRTVGKNSIINPYNEQYVVHGIVHVCKNVYEIKHELIYEVYAIPGVICSVAKCEGDE